LDCHLNNSYDPNLQAFILADLCLSIVALLEIKPNEILVWDFETTEEDLALVQRSRV